MPRATLSFVSDGPLGEGDVAHLSRRALALPGVEALDRWVDDRHVVVSFDTTVTRRAIVQEALERPDLRLVGAGSLGHRLAGALAPGRLARGAREVWASEQRVPALLVLGCLAFAITGFAVQGAAGLGAALPFYAVAYACGGWGATRTAFGSLRRRSLDVDLLMLIAATGAAIVGAWWEGAVLLFLFSLGGLLEEFALGRTHRSVRALMDLRPEVVRVRDEDGGEHEIPVDDVVPGQVAAVRPGERIPVDGVVVHGSSEVDQSAITGESMPVGRGPGEEVFAGTFSVSGYLEVEVTRLATDTMLSRVITLVAEAQAQRAPAQRAIDRYQPVYVAGVLGVALFAFLGFLLAGHDTGDAFLQAMTLLVVASPCALVISVPASMLSALARAARDGILVKGSGPLEQMARLRTVAFDKTGTLTTGELAVEEVVPAPGVCPGMVLSLAASVEVLSRHPVARAVVAAAAESGVPAPAAEDFRTVHGRGAMGTVEGRRIVVGSPAMMAEEGVEAGPLAAAAAERAGEGHVLVGEAGGSVAGLLVVRDRVRAEARETLARLHALGCVTVMLSGDRAPVADRVADSVGVGEVAADLLPDAKVERVRDLAAAGPVAMVGDGVNDAPALAAATVGIAMGVRGSDQALETADVVLMADRLSGVPDVVGLARRMRRVVRQNLAFAGGVIIVLSVLAVFGVVPLPVGVLGHEGSTIIVTANGLRLLRARRAPAPHATTVPAPGSLQAAATT